MRRIVLLAALGGALALAGASARAEGGPETGAALSAPGTSLPAPPPAYGGSEPAEAGEPLPANVASVELARPVFGVLTLELERRVTPRLGVFLAPSLLLPGVAGSLDGAGLEGGLRLYFGQRPPTGFWVAPRAGVGAIRGVRLGQSRSAPAYSLGLRAGLTWELRSVLLSIGGGITWADMEVRVAGAPLGFRGVGPDARVALGRAF